MSNVTLSIAGRKYTIACAEGEERHIEMLGASIDAKLAQLDNLTGQSPERILLYATLLLADELYGARPASSVTPSEHLAGQLEALAERAESLASEMDNGLA